MLKEPALGAADGSPVARALRSARRFQALEHRRRVLMNPEDESVGED